MTRSLVFLQPASSRYYLVSSSSPFLQPRRDAASDPSLLVRYATIRISAKKTRSSVLISDVAREECFCNLLSRPKLKRRMCSFLSSLRASMRGTTFALSLLLHARSVSTILSHSMRCRAATSFDSGNELVEACNGSSMEGAQQLLPAVETSADYSNQKAPLILKYGMDIPEKWNVPGGTVVLMDKPKGWTSFTVCERIRKLVQVKKVGHAGTLDPMATGLLVVCVGPATKLADRFQALTKVYTGTFRLGEATSSCDADSLVIERKPWEHITDTDLQKAREGFLGEIMQIPPMFSAIKVDGERLYEKARRGEQIDVPARKITIYDFQIERSKENRQELDFYVRCSKGTYIRSLCADMGKSLNSCAHLTKLRREKIGELDISDAWQFEDLSHIYNDLYRKPVVEKAVY